MSRIGMTEKNSKQKHMAHMLDYSDRAYVRVREVIRQRPYAFMVSWVMVFTLLLGASWSFGIVPKLDLEPDTPLFAEAEESASSTEAIPTAPEITDDGLPVRIIIDSIGVDSHILNPSSTDIDVLDNALLSGVVRYPTSGTLNDTSNLFLFGHSTGFRVVNNQSFKVFNDLKHLEKGDIIRVRSSVKEDLYRVDSVTLTTAEDAFVELSNREKKLTLSTCNSFGAKQERYVVDASFIGEYTL